MSEKVILTYYHADGRTYDIKESPLVECSVCARKADLMCIVDDMCIDCVEAELERLREESDLWQKTEKAWYAEKRQLLQELARLQGIEAAVLGGQQRSHAVSYYRQIAELMEELPGLAGDLNAIADALEAE